MQSGHRGRTHELKTLPNFFQAAADGNKNFEIRKDDRGYQVGDMVLLREWNGQGYTGRELQARPIRYILRSCTQYGLMDGYCILGF